MLFQIKKKCMLQLHALLTNFDVLRALRMPFGALPFQNLSSNTEFILLIGMQ